MRWGRKLSPVGQNRRQEGAWFALFFGSALNALSQFDRVLANIVRRPVRKEMHLSNKDIAIPDTMYNTLFLIFGVLAGSAIDAGLNRRLILGGGLFLWSVATSLTAFSPNLTALVLFDALVGLAEGAVHTTLLPFVADFYPAHERGLMFAALFTSTVIGSALGFVVGGVLVGSFGWRHMYFLCGLPGVVVSASVLFLHDPAAGVNDKVDNSVNEPSSLSSLLYGWLEIVTYPHFMVALSATAAHLFIGAGFHAYLPEYLSQQRGFSIEHASILSGIALIGGLFGTPVGAVAMARSSIKNAPFLFCACFLLCNTFFGFLIVNLPAGNEVLFMFLIMWSFFGTATVAPGWTLSVTTMPARLRGRAQGFWAVFTKLLGAVPSVLFFGAVDDSYGLVPAMQLTWLLTLVTVALWWIGYSCTPPLGDFGDERNRDTATSDVNRRETSLPFVHLETPETNANGPEHCGAS